MTNRESRNACAGLIRSTPITTNNPQQGVKNGAKRVYRKANFGLSAANIEEIRLASSKMRGAERRAYEAEMALKYCGGSPRRAEDVFGWSRQAVELGLHEKRTGIVCLGHQKFCCGAKLWEEKHPDVAQALWQLAQSHSQPDSTSRTTVSFTRFTPEEAIKQLRAQGFLDDVLPSRSGMANVLKRNGYRLRPVVETKPQKKSPKPTPSSPLSRHTTDAAKAERHASEHGLQGYVE